jgi:hypothetical protein
MGVRIPTRFIANCRQDEGCPLHFVLEDATCVPEKLNLRMLVP